MTTRRSQSLAVNARASLGTVLNPFPSVLKDGNTVAFFDAFDLTTITKNGSNVVSRVNDKLLSGHDLTSGSCVWSETNGLTFDGVAHYLKSAGFTLNQPETIYMFLKQPTWKSNGHIIDGNAHGSGMIIQGGTTAVLQSYAGALLSGFPDLQLDAWGILRNIFNGASSTQQINERTAKTGNTGTGNMGGITLGRYADAALQYGNYYVKEIIIRKTADDDATQTIIYDYLRKKYAETVLVIGDSNTGQSPQWAEYYPIGWVGGKTPLTLNNAKVGCTIVNIDSNNVTHPYMAYQVQQATNYRLDRIIIMLGTNDGLSANVGIEYAANIAQLKADHPTAIINCISILPYQSGDETVRDTNNAILQPIAEGLGCTWWDNTNWVNRDATDFVDSRHLSVTGQLKFAAEVRSRLNV